MENKTELVELAVDVVAAYVGNNAVTASDLPNLIKEVHSAIKSASTDSSEAGSALLKPAVSIRKSLTPDYIICLEDGKKFKSLKRHLRTHYDLTPEEYREKWSLPRDYPMVAPNYATARSNLAKQMGLGQKGRSKAAS
jgi:MucR family transcriptional regulator, transcriptional regulator of exopolysaccharide biosynthesis